MGKLDMKYSGVSKDNGKIIYGNYIMPEDYKEVTDKIIWLGRGDEYAVEWHQVENGSVIEL